MISKSIPQGPRNPNGYTEQEIEGALTGASGHRRLTFRYELLDRNMSRIRDLDNVLSGSIQQSYISEIKRTAEFEIRDQGDIDFLHDYIKPYCRLWMPPRWTEDKEVPQWRWDNKFGAQTAIEDATAEDLSSFGSSLGGLSGPVSIVLSPRIASSASVRMGDTNASMSVSDSGVSADRTRFRTYLYLHSGASASVSWRSEVDGDLAPTQGGLELDSSSDELRIDGAVIDEVPHGKWIRVEVDFGETELEFRVYHTNPYGGVADIIHPVPNPASSDILGFDISRTGGGSEEYLFVGPTAFADLVLIEARPNFTDHDFVEVPLGVFLMSSPDKEIDETRVVTRSISAVDRTQLLIDDKLTERFIITKGENYTEVLNSLLENYPRAITPSTWVCGRTREFSVGTSMKEVVDRIAESINYHTVRFDAEGVLYLAPYISPADRTPEYHYTDNEYSIMGADADVEFDLSEIPNVWIVSLNEADEKAVYIKLENHDPANPFSIPSRGRKIVDFREQEEGFDRASLMRKARRIQFEANRQFENISFSTAINPFHDSNDCYTMDYGAAGVNNKYTEINWEFKLAAGEKMSHTCRRVIELDPELYPGFIDGHLQVDGAVTMSNMKWGTVALAGHSSNKPTAVDVTGLSLTGTGRTQVFLTAIASSAALTSLKGCGASNRTANGFKLWSYRTNTAGVSYYWLAVRDV